MRKFLSLFAAVLVALVANAAVINITNGTPDALRMALGEAGTGDIIEMAAGTYVESNSNYIAFDGKEVIVRAAEGAEVLIQPQVPITIANGALAKFENIKFDASRLVELATWYEHLIYATDASANNRLIMEGCELYGFNLNKSAIYCSTANALDAVTLNNCYIHDCMKSILFVENTANAINVQVTNSTFANISTNTESYWAGVMDVRASGASLLVDHCTFYNVIPMNTDYSCVSKITLANGVTSNCIFMLPTAQDNIRAMRGVTATNCITYNYLKDSGTGIHSSVTKNNCVQADPLFVDAANGNFTLGEGSPALTMNDGQPIGDPRWVAAPAHTYTVAGSSTDLFGTAWAPTNAANDMALVEGLYKWEKTEITLAAGMIEFKVCEDHGWDVAYPGSNYQLNIPEAGIYTITITFNADSKEVTAIATKTGSAEVDPTVSIKGGWDGWAAEVAFTLADNKETATGALNIAEAGNYEFKVILNGSDWRSNGYTYHREFTGADGITGNGDNMVLQADAAGEYTITWTFATNALNITFPAVAPQPVDEWAEIKFAEAAAANDIAEDAAYAVPGTEFALTLHDAGNKMVIDGNDCRFGTAEDYVMYNFRIKSGGASSSTKNYFTLNIPEAGTLRLAPRTGSNSATDRALVIAQGETELYNAVVQESQAIEVQEGENTVKVYPYVDVTVAAGEVRVSYTAGMNFYAFAFKAGGDAPVVLDAPDAAPTAPTYENYQVHAAYSATYNADCNFGEWESGTVYTQEEFGKKYVTNGAGYFGLEFGGMNCSEMEALHLDVWIAADASIRIVPIHGGTEVGVTAQLEGQKWNSIDIALSEFEGVTNWSNVYQIKIDNASNLTFWLNNVYFYTTQEKTVDLVDGYYLIGNINGWDIHNLTADHLFAVNPANEAEYILHYTLAEGNEFKVVSVASNAIATWYPGEAGNYVVDFAHAGEKDIYFRPDYQGGEGWHAGCIYVAADENANPYETWFASGDSWNQETESYLEWDAEAQKATVHINVDKYGQWRAQVKYHGLVAEEGKCYHVALKLKSNNAISNVTIKYQDDKEMMYVNNAALEANVEYAFDQTAAGIAGGNGILVLDFGFAHAGDIIEIYDVVIEETECPAIEHTYTVAGGSADLFGTTWDPANTANDMTKLEDGTYKFEKTEITLPAGAIEFKVCEDHAWTHCYPAENYSLAIPEAGVYTITITFNPEGNVVAAEAVKTGDAQVDPVVSIAGSMNSWNASADVMVLAEDKATASLTLNLAAQTYEFKVVLNGGDWRSNAQEFTRESATAADMTGNLDNMHLVADIAGDYVFTWTFETNTLSIAFPIGAGIDNTAVEAKAIKRIVNGQLRIEMNGVEYNAQGQVVK